MALDESLLDLLYDGITDDLAWNEALAIVANDARASGAGLGVQDMKTHAFWAVAQSGVDPALHETYQRSGKPDLAGNQPCGPAAGRSYDTAEA